MVTRTRETAGVLTFQEWFKSKNMAIIKKKVFYTDETKHTEAMFLGVKVYESTHEYYLIEKAVQAGERS